MSSKIIYNLKKIEENIQSLLNINLENTEFIYPVKCCHHKEILKLFSKYNFGFDISNLNEYKLIKDYTNNSLISFSSPYTNMIDKRSIPNNTILFFNSTENVSINDLISDENLGFRINFNNNENFKQSRFGVEFNKLLEFKDHIKNIHFHNCDKHKDKLLPHYKEILSFLINNFKNLKLINIGGHYEYYDKETIISFFKEIRSIIPPHIKLVIEGAGIWFEYAIRLETTIININHVKKTTMVSVDLCAGANLKWSWPRYENKLDGNNKVEFYGASCFEDDYICSSETNDLFRIGDLVSFWNISPYSYSWDTSFNGINSPTHEFI